MPAKKKATAKKTVEKKTAKKAPAKKAAAKKAPAKKTAAKKAPARKKTRTTFTPEERFRQIQEAAYYIAEKSDFTRNATECWVEAESLITRLEQA